MKDSSLKRVTRLLKRGVYDQPADTVDLNIPAAILAFDTLNLPKTGWAWQNGCSIKTIHSRPVYL